MQSRQFSTSNRSWSVSQSADAESTLSTVCLQIVDLGMVAIVFISPLLFGARHPIGRFALVALCGLVASAWFVRQALVEHGKWTRSTSIWLLLLATAMVALQIASLPQEWLNSMAPRLGELLPLWTGDAATQQSLGQFSLGTWSTISISPEDTRLALATLVAYTLLFVTATQRLQSVGDVKRIVNYIAVSAAIGAVFGLVQYFTSNGLFFWFYEYPYTNTADEVKGSFTCRNHFAHFVMLGTAPLIALFLNRMGSTNNKEGKPGSTWTSGSSQSAIDPLTMCLGIAVLVAVAAVLCSLSRGACLALGVCLCVLGAAYLKFRLVKVADLALLASAGAILLFGVVSFYGYEKIASRLDDFTDGSVKSLDARGGRRTIWAANAEAIEAGWQAGSGVGTHPHIYPVYLKAPLNRLFMHSESSPLQIVTESGLPGVAFLVAGLACVGFWCCAALVRAQEREQQLYVGAVIASLAGNVAHAPFDFVWFVPACMAVTILLAACALRLAQLTKPKVSESRVQFALMRPAWWAIGAVVLLASGWSTYALLPAARAALHWDRYHLANNAEKAVNGDFSVASVHADFQEQQANSQLIHYRSQLLSKVISVNPSDARAHMKLAANLLKEFNLQGADAMNQMTVTQIRDSAIGSNFASSKELQAWLQRAFGKRSQLLYRALYHSKQAVRLSPFQGEAYTFLAGLAFLEGRGNREVEALWNQALTVGPRDSDVLFEVGTQLLAARRPAQAFEVWKILFKSPTRHQLQVVNLMAPHIPAEGLLGLLQPGPSVLQPVWQHYAQRGTQQDRLAIETYVATIIQSKVRANDTINVGKLWKLLAQIQTVLEKPEAAIVSYQQAIQAEPQDFGTHFYLGATLANLGQFEAAEKQFSWCLARRPDHAGTKAMLMEIGRQRLTYRAGEPSPTKSL